MSWKGVKESSHGIYLEGAQETTKTSDKIVGAPAEIGTDILPNSEALPLEPTCSMHISHHRM
jgi:hypothetical protein